MTTTPTTTMTMLLHAYAKVGKSQLADTAPGPRLIIDTENGTGWTPSNKVLWNPMNQPVPKLGPDDTCLVQLKDVRVLDNIMQVLRSNGHPFNSVVVDSLMELQKRALTSISNGQQPQIQHWGELLRKMEQFCADLRDLTMENGSSLPVVIVVTGTAPNDQTGQLEPFLKGSIIKSLPYLFDVTAYLKVGYLEDGTPERRLAIAPAMDGKNSVYAGSRLRPLNEHYGDFIANPNLTEMYNFLKEARVDTSN
jgi:hypothetical protein